MVEQDVSFKLEETKVKLAKGGEMSVVYALPAKLREPTTSLIIAHGAGSPMHSPFIRYFHTELARHGYVTAKFNFPYMEARRKVPDRNDVLESSFRAVLEAVGDGDHRTVRLLIGGKSMGGRIASQIAAKDGVKVDGLFFLGYPLHPPGHTDQLRDEHLYKITKPMLFLSGTRDTFARRDLLERVVAGIGGNAQLRWIENGDHSFKTLKTASGNAHGISEALGVLLKWLEDLPRA